MIPNPRHAGRRLRIGPGNGLPALCRPGPWRLWDPDQALQRSHEALPLPRTLARGWARAKRGAPEPGIAQIRQGVATLQALGSGEGRPFVLAHLAEVHSDVGQPEEGLRLLSEALAVARHMGERWWEAELYRLKRELLLALSQDH
jgi:predicted ATPase